MTDPTTAATTAFDAGTDAIKAAAEAAAAQEMARAADTAALLSKVDEHLKAFTKENAENMTESIKVIVSDALGRVTSRYVDTDRIPLICQSVFAIQDDVKESKEDLKELKEDLKVAHEKFVTKDGQYFIVRMLVFSGAGIVLAGFAKLIFDSVSK
jgi:hypothetical protein